MVRSDPHMISLKRSFLQAIIDEVEAIGAAVEALLAAPHDRVACIVDQVLERLEYGERALIELLFGFVDGYKYNHDQAADLFHMLPDHVPYETSRILSRCWQILEHIGA